MAQAPQGLEKLLSDYQHARILRRAFPNNDAPKFRLLVNQLDAGEALSAQLHAACVADVACHTAEMTRDARP